MLLVIEDTEKLCFSEKRNSIQSFWLIALLPVSQTM